MNPTAAPFRASRGVSALLAISTTLLFFATRPAAGVPVKPWVPPGADSLVAQVAEANVRFQAQTGDSISGPNYRPYEIVGNAAHRLLRSMGPANLIQAHAVEAILDSLGLDTELVLEPRLTGFCLLMVRNPYHPKSKSVGFLYWYKGSDLRMQGAQFSGGQHPLSRVWWANDETYPYTWAVVDFARGDGNMHFTLFRLIASGNFWMLAQYEDSGYHIGDPPSAAFVDLNGDAHPELVAWMRGESDTLFEDCADCPRPIVELLFAERAGGFAIQDTRVVPSAYSTFERFVRLLADGNRAQAARLLEDPSLLQNAIAAGWGASRPRSWRVEGGEQGTSWPSWLSVRFAGADRARRYTVQFSLVNGRWMIRDWAEPHAPVAATRGTVGGAAPKRAAPKSAVQPPRPGGRDSLSKPGGR